MKIMNGSKAKFSLRNGGFIYITVMFILVVLIGLGIFIRDIIVQNNQIYAGIVIVGAALLFYASSIFLFRKYLLGKIIFSTSGVEWKLFSRTIYRMEWNEITEVKQTYQGRVICLSFFKGKDEIKIDFHFKIYAAIMILCPLPWIKNVIDSSECLRQDFRERMNRQR